MSRLIAAIVLGAAAATHANVNNPPGAPEAIVAVDLSGLTAPEQSKYRQYLADNPAKAAAYLRARLFIKAVMAKDDGREEPPGVELEFLNTEETTFLLKRRLFKGLFGLGG